jgi:hypothetical protein
MQLYRYFVSQSSEFCRHNPLCCFSTSNTKNKRIFRYRLSPETFDTPSSLEPDEPSPHLRNLKVKVKLSLCWTKHHTMKAYWGSGDIAPRILDLAARSIWVVSFTPRPLYPQEKSPWNPLERRLDGPQSRSGLGGEGKNSYPPPGIEP